MQFALVRPEDFTVLVHKRADTSQCIFLKPRLSTWHSVKWKSSRVPVKVTFSEQQQNAVIFHAFWTPKLVCHCSQMFEWKKRSCIFQHFLSEPSTVQYQQMGGVLKGYKLLSQFPVKTVMSCMNVCTKFYECVAVQLADEKDCQLLATTYWCETAYVWTGDAFEVIRRS